MSNYKVGYSLLSNLNPKTPGFDVSANNLASSGVAIIGDNLKNLQDLSANLPSGNINYFQVAVIGNFNNYGSSTDVSGISTGSYYTNNVSAMRIAADSSANRPTIATSLPGFIRYNIDNNHLEYYYQPTTTWLNISKFQSQSNQVTAVLTSGTGTITVLYTDPNGLNPSSTTPYYNGYTVCIMKNTGGTGSSSAVFTVTPSTNPPFGSNINYLLVGGGGGGGAHQSPANAIDKAGAGGGAGGYIYNTLTPVPGTVYTISVGSGGAGGTTSGSTFTTFYGTNGNNSTITTSGPNPGNLNGIVAYGGGGGASGYTNGPFFGNIGGSGGGGVASGFQPGFGGSPYGGDVSNNTQSPQGWAGGTGIISSTGSAFTANNGSAGGGGAGGIGGNPSTLITKTIVNGGQGGPGLQNSITGTASYYAAGGGGGAFDASGSTSGIGGTGGSGIGGSGGNSGSPAQIGTDASANTGSGGGGAGGGSTGISATSSAGGAGSAGICVFRFSTNNLSYLPPPTLKTATVTGGTAYSVYFTDQNGLNPSQTPYSNPVGYTVYVFLNSAAPGSASSLAYTFTPYFNDSSVNVLLVGGGGGAGFSNGNGDGGGGGGGVLALTNYNVVAYTSISLSVGCGGTVYTNASGVPGPTSSQTSATGAQSTFGSYTLLGGGFGGVYNAYDPVPTNNGAPGNGANGGGSSGRGGATTKTPGTGTAPPASISGYINYYYGYSGGTGVTGAWDGGGGGGGALSVGVNGQASAVGGNAYGGNGGNGYLSSISGYNIYYGGGGGGGTDWANSTGPSWTPPNPGGYGGGTTSKGASGGNGAGLFNTYQVYGGQPGINGTGQGGGGGNGGGMDNVSSFYGFGGGGTVIIRYRSF